MSTGKIKGITVEIGGDTRPLNDALKKSEKQIKTTQSELREVNRQLKFDPTNTELLRQKQTLLASAVSETRQKLDTLKQAEKQAQEQFKRGDISAEQYRSLQREVVKTEGQLKSLEKQAAQSNATIEKIKGVADSVSQGAKKVSGAMAPVSAAIVGAGAYAVKAMDEVDVGLDTLATKTGATGETAKDLQEVYKQVAEEIPGDFGDIGAAVGELNTRLDFTGEKLKSASVDFLKFAKVNGTDVNTSVQLVTRAMGDAGISAGQYKPLLDALTVAAQKSGISIDTLTTNLAKYGAPMRALGIDTENAIALFAGWEKAGVNTEIAFSGMKKAISTWGAANKDPQKEFAKTMQQIKDCPDLASATTLAIEAFGQKAGPDLADAIKGGRFEVESYAKAIQNSAGTVESTYSQVVDEVDDAQLAAQNLKLGLHDLGETVAKTLGPIFLKIAQSVKQLLDRFNELSPAGKKTVMVIAGIVAAIAPMAGVVSVIAKMTSGIMSLSETFKTLKSATQAQTIAQKALNLVMNHNIIFLVITAITALVAGFMYLWKNCEGFRNFWIGLWDKIKTVTSNAVEALKTFFTVTIPNAFNAVIDWIKANWQGLLLLIVNPFAGAFKLLYENCEGFRNFINNFLQKIKDFFVNTWNSIVTFFTESIPNAFAQLVAWFSELPAKIGYEIGRILANIVNFGVNAWNWVTTELPKIIQGIVDWFASLPGRIWTWLVNAVNNVIAWGTAVKNHATALIKAAIDAVVNWFATLPSRIWTWLVNAKNRVTEWGASVKERASALTKQTIDAVVNWFKSLPDRVKEWLTKTKDRVVSWGKETAQKGKEGAQDLFNNIVNTVKELPGKMLDIGKNIVTGIWDGIKNKVTWIKDKIKDFAGGIVKGFKDNLEIHSPSRVFADQIGKFIPEGIWQGISGAMGKLQSNMKQSVGRLVEATQGSVNATMMTTAGGSAGGKSMSFTQNNTFNGYQSRDGARAVEDLNRKLGIAYGGAF